MKYRIELTVLSENLKDDGRDKKQKRFDFSRKRTAKTAKWAFPGVGQQSITMTSSLYDFSRRENKNNKLFDDVREGKKVRSDPQPIVRMREKTFFYSSAGISLIRSFTQRQTSRQEGGGTSIL